MIQDHSDHGASKELTNTPWVSSFNAFDLMDLRSFDPDPDHPLDKIPYYSCSVSPPR